MIGHNIRIALSAALVSTVSLWYAPPAAAAPLLRPLAGTESSLVEKRLASDKTLKRKRLVAINAAVIAAEILPAGTNNAADRVKKSLALSGTLELNLFSDVTVRLKRKSVEKSNAGGVVWTAAGGGNNGAILVVNNGRVTGSVNYNGRSFLLEPTGRGDEHRVREVNLDAFLNDRHLAVSLAPKTRGGGKGGKGGGDSGGGGTIIGGTSGGGTTTTGTILEAKILAAYTARANTLLGGVPADKAALDVAIVNMGLANSKVPLHLNLVGATAVSTGYDETGYSNSAQPLYDLTSGSVANFQSIRDLRTSLAADFVTLYADRREYCGVAWINTITSSAYAFSVVNPACSGTTSLAHELGHNMGLYHDRYVETQTGSDVYNYGFVNTSGQFRDIMSYNNQCAALGLSCQQITYYSSSSLTYNGFKLGIPQGLAGAADASRKLSEQAPAIASFR